VSNLSNRCIIGFIAHLLVALFPAASLADLCPALEGKPNINKPDTSKYAYVLVAYNPAEANVTYAVKFTNFENASDDISDAQFRSWCNTFGDVANVHAKLLVAADEHFKLDYSKWVKAPFHLPLLISRWFEVLDDWSFYICEIPK
jgi:hypothetical protein